MRGIIRVGDATSHGGRVEKAASGYQGEIQKAAGDIVKGQTDSSGKLSPINSNQVESLVADPNKQFADYFTYGKRNGAGWC